MKRIKLRQRVYYAVGDVHGMSFKLAKMLKLITEDAKKYQDQNYLPILVMLGDYVDRGPDSKGVIDLLLKGIPGFMHVYLAGNHELMMTYALVYGGQNYDPWLAVGGKQCLDSYGYSWDGEDPIVYIPEEHLQFLKDLRALWITNKFIFAHAGIDPSVPLSEQKGDADNGTLWIRDPFLKYEGKFEGSRMVIHGHTPSRKGVVIKHNRICLDTAACYRGTLSCAVLTNNDEPRFITV